MMTVGTAPGTTTVHYNPYSDLVNLSSFRGLGIPKRPTPDGTSTSTTLRGSLDRPLRWDLIGIVGGGSLVVALTAALIANAVSRRGR